MKSPRLFWIIVCVLIFGCSKDDSPSTPGEVSKIPNFKLIGEDDESIYQYNHDALQDGGETVNITKENRVSRRYITIRQIDDVLTFYSFTSGSFSAVQRNVITGESESIENFHTASNAQSIIWGTNSENQLFLGYYSPQGSNNYGIKSIELSNMQEQDMMIEFNVQNVFQPLYRDGRLVLSYQDQNSGYKAVIIDTDTNTIRSTIDFGSSSPSIFVDGNGNFAVISASQNTNYKYSVYDAVTLEVLKEITFSLNKFFSPGPLEADEVDEKLFYLNEYAQPSPILFGPAVYDFATAENRIIDMIGIVDNVEQELQVNIILSAFGYDANSNTFLIGYANSDNLDNLEGGVLIISEKGELLKTVELPFAPTYFVKE